MQKSGRWKFQCIAQVHTSEPVTVVSPMKPVTSQQDVQPDRVGPVTIARAIPNAAEQFVGPIL